MKGVVHLRRIFGFVLFLIFFLPSVYSQTVTPPPAAVPEGNTLTAAALVGSGLYMLYLKRRRGVQ